MQSMIRERGEIRLIHPR